jgi:hypothetical protein
MRLVLVAVLVLSSVSFAQNTSGAQKRVPQTTINFEDPDLVDGTLKSPDAEMIRGRVHIRFTSMIRVRSNFADKLMHSVNELR